MSVVRLTSGTPILSDFLHQDVKANADAGTTICRDEATGKYYLSVDGVVTELSNKGYVLPFLSSSATPADSTTIYIGGIPVGTGSITTQGVNKIIVPKTGTLVRADMTIVVGGTLGSSEYSTAEVLVNGLDNGDISAMIQTNAAVQSYSAAFAVAVVAGDYMEIKWTTPEWATNPTIVLTTGSLYIQ